MVVETVDGDLFHLNRALTHEDLDMERDELSDLVGDKQARVSVSMDLGDKSFGNGFGAHVTVSLTCNQDEETIRDTFVIAKGLTDEFVEEAFEQAQVAYKR